MRSLTLAAFAFAIGAPVSAQEAKIPAAPVPSSDVKTVPIPYAPEASGPVRKHVVDEAAQRAPAPAATPQPRRMPSWPLYDVAEDGTTWVRGATYKASFGTDGATYVPFLGSHAPRNFPVTFRTASATAGGVPIAFDAAAGAERQGALVRFDRGGFVEEYAIERDTIEQRFVFDALPVRGDVVVAIDVETELSALSDQQGFRFANEFGHASYGRAFALDATGKKIGIDSRLETGRIVLTVPAEFVATAVLPLVIDPITGTFTVTALTESQTAPDVAYEAGTNSLLVVYEDEYSATDHDVYAERYVDQVYEGIATIDFSTSDWRQPKVAANRLAEQFLVVAQAGDVGVRSIRGRTVEADTLTTSSQFTISGAESGDLHNPDVGGDPETVGPTYYCVVWERDFSSTDHDVLMRLVRSTGTLVGTGTVYLENSVAYDRFPSISKTDGLSPFVSQMWTILWQHEQSSTNEDVQGARIRWDGEIIDPTFSVAATIENETAPVASDPLDETVAGRPWLAAYTLTDPNGGSDLRLRAFSAANGVLDTIDIELGVLSFAGSPCISIDGRMWQVAYSVRTGLFPNTDTDLWAAGLYIQGGNLNFSEDPIAIATSGETESSPESASTFGSANPYRTYVGWQRWSATYEYDIFVSTHDSVLNADRVAYCFGTDATCPCGNGGNGSSGCANSVNANGARLDSIGTAFVSGDSFQLQATGMPLSTTCLFFQGTSTSAATFGDGLRCASGSIRRLSTEATSGGTARYGYPYDTPISVRGLIPDAGGRRYYQVWYRNAASFCTASTFNLSNGLGVTWLP